MRLFLLGRRHSVNHWLEDAAGAFRALGHEVAVGHVRRPPIPRRIELALAAPIGERLAARVARFDPDLVLVIGAFHAPREMLEPIAAAPRRPPLAGWVGDAFDEGARALAGLYDLVGFTDTALKVRHEALGFAAASLFLPHAADPAVAAGGPPAARRARAVFVANPTPHRRAIVREVRAGLALVGPAWSTADGAQHEIDARRIPAEALRSIYAGHTMALNIRNEANVLAGLNQRSFEPFVQGAAVLADDQPDLPLCFEPGREVGVWRDAETLNALYDRWLAAPQDVAEVARRGRARVLAEHTYAARLQALMRAL